jgi:hypothetical protein
MINDENRGRVARSHSLHGPNHRHSALRVECAEGFIEHQDLGLERECTGQREPLALAPREGPGGPVSVETEFHSIESQVDAFLHELARHQGVFQAKGNVIVEPRHHCLILGLLQDDSDPW